MTIEDPVAAEALLCQLNHYRFSGYWNPRCRFDRATGQSLDFFRSSATFGLVHKLHLFDERLRRDVSGELAQVELAAGALLGYKLGSTAPFTHLEAKLLGALARHIHPKSGNTRNDAWAKKDTKALHSSRDDCSAHHEIKRGGILPIGAAVGDEAVASPQPTPTHHSGSAESPPGIG